MSVARIGYRTYDSEGGNVGFGTTNPTHLLHLYSTNATDNGYASAGILLQNATSNEVGIAFQTAAMGDRSWVVGVNSNQARLDISYAVQSNQIPNVGASLTLLPHGNIGIGTTNPQTRLEVSGTNATFRISDYTANGTPSIELVRGTSNTFGGDVRTDWRIIASNNQLIISEGDINGNSNVLTLTPDGNALLGTTTQWASYRTTSNVYWAQSNLLLPTANGTLNGVNITALNQRTRTSYATAKAAVSTWIPRALAGGAEYNSWFNICWSPDLSLFCAVGLNFGGSKCVMISPDGITWTLTGPPYDGSFSVCWSPELSIFCVVGYNRVMTSSNGINWTVHDLSGTSAQLMNWVSVCWSPELSLFCAVADGGPPNRVMTSPDGITWTTRTPAGAALETNDWRDICWSPELSMFCAIAVEGGSQRVMISYDGIIWRTSFTYGIVNTWYNICWSSEHMQFCAITKDTNNNVNAWTSPDGISWVCNNISGIDPGSYVFYDICWSPELSLFVAVGHKNIYTGGEIVTIASRDGKHWTSPVLTGTTRGDNGLFYICWSPELSIFCLTGGNRVVTSRPALPAPRSAVLASPTHVLVNPDSGFVGIGTNDPIATLHVNGTLALKEAAIKNNIPVACLQTGFPSSGTITVNGMRFTGSASGLGNHTFIISALGELWSWGDNGSAMLGYPQNSDPNPTPRKLVTGSLVGEQIAAVVCSLTFTVALDSSGVVHTWGQTVFQSSNVPISVTSGSLAGNTVKAIACGAEFSLALDITGNIHGWGSNNHGELGTANNEVSLPVVVDAGSLSGNSIVTISCGNKFCVALDSTGAIHAWGKNDGGQLSFYDSEIDSSAETNYPTPLLVQSEALTGKNIVAIACGYYHVLALDDTGTITGWGNNDYGQLGNSTDFGVLSPAEIVSGSLYGKVIVAIACGEYHSVALDSEGHIHTWGDNSSGQLGYDLSYNPTPAQVTQGSVLNRKFVSIACGWYHTMALDDMGQIHLWGYNDKGQLGNVIESQSYLPLVVARTAFGGTYEPVLSMLNQDTVSILSNVAVQGSVRTSGPLISDVATGMPPFTVTSSTMVSNLNANLLEGYNAGYFMNSNSSVTSNQLPDVEGLDTTEPYGSATAIPRITIDTKGRIMSITNEAVYIPDPSPWLSSNSNVYVGTGSNVGIGTTAPLYRLHVAGDLYANGYSNLPSASTSAAGIVQLTDSTSSTSATTAATPNAVKGAYDLAAAALSRVTGGTVQNNVVVQGTLTASNLIVLGDVTTLDTYVSQTSNVSIVNTQGTGPALYVSQTGIGLQYAVAEFFDTDVSTTTPVFKIAEGGNVGIGTTNPTHKLHILSSSSTDNDYEGAGILLQNTTSNEVGLAMRTAAMGTNTWVMGVNSNQTRLDIGYGLQTNQLLDGDVKMTVLPGGNVGIGTTVPLGLFSVRGTNQTYGTRSFLVEDSAGASLLQVYNNGIIAFKNQAEIRVDVGAAGFIWFGHGTNIDRIRMGQVNSSGFNESSGITNFLNVRPVVNQSGTASYTAVNIASTETSLGSGANYFINAQGGVAGTTQQFFVKNNGDAYFAGNVGIGTNNALAKAHILHTGTGDIFRVDDQSAPDTTPFIINQDGNVGVGTSNPRVPLDVFGNMTVGRGQLGTSNTMVGGPFMKQEPWDAAGTTHTIAYPAYCIGDNSTGTIHIHATNKSTVTPKLGTLQCMFLKQPNTNVNLFETMSQRSTGLGTFTVSASTSNIVVTTDSDCSICWTSVGAY